MFVGFSKRLKAMAGLRVGVGLRLNTWYGFILLFFVGIFYLMWYIMLFAGWGLYWMLYGVYKLYYFIFKYSIFGVKKLYQIIKTRSQKVPK